MVYIEIAGAMGTGKSSLARLFNERAGYATVSEKEGDLQRLFFVEPYLSDPQKYGFEGAINFLAFHLNRIKEGLKDMPENQDVIVDTSLLLQYAYHKAVLPADELKTIGDVIAASYKKLPQVDLRIVLTLPIDVHVERIKKRGRSTEKNVPREFLIETQKALHEAVEKYGNNTPVLYLDASQLNWVSNEEDKKTVIRLVQQKLAGGPA